MFILRQIHKESGLVSNFVIGNSYSIHKDSKQFYPKSKTSDPILVGTGMFTHSLHFECFEYYIMLDNGKTFEKLSNPFD